MPPLPHHAEIALTDGGLLPNVDVGHRRAPRTLATPPDHAFDGVRVVPRTVRTRSAADAILEEASRARAEIVVLGVSRGPRLGSTIEFVLKHAPCRVMLASSPPPAE